MRKQHDIRIDRSLLHPHLNKKLTKLLEACAKNGIYLIITEGFRTKEYQDKLYAKGRTAPGSIVTNARGSSYSSQHMWGVAFDIAINDNALLYSSKYIQKVANIAKGKDIDLGWGGDWRSFKDTPHFYLKTWGSTTSTLKSKFGTPENFKKTWTKTVNKVATPFWDDKKKKKRINTLPKGKKVQVLYIKGRWASVKFGDKYGFINKNFLK